MGGLWVADATGLYREVKNLSVADATGAYRDVIHLFVADATGTYRELSGLGVDIRLTPGSVTPRWSKLKFFWTAVDGATVYKLFRASSGTPLYSGGALTATVDAVPGSDYNIHVEAYNGSTLLVSSDVVAVRTAGLPSPTRLRTTSVTTTAAVIDWDAVADATAYELKNNLTGTLAYSGPSAGPRTVSVDPGVAYAFSVRAKLGSAVSGWTTRLSFRAPRPSGPAHGVYNFFATSSATWSPAFGSWRPMGDGLYHGNGHSWGSPRGDQSGWFFYGGHPFTALHGGRVTSFRVFLHRTDDAGYNAAQVNHWLLHNFTGRPAGTPLGGGIDGNTDVGSLARGDGGWFNLPVSWGQALVNGSEAGVGWGNVYNRYMHADDVGSSPNNGKLEITIG